MSEALLPLGSVIKVKDTKGDWMIVGRGTLDEQNRIWDYSCVPHPAGLIDMTKILSLSRDQVDEVIFEGFSTESSTQLSHITADFIDGKIDAEELEERLGGVSL